MGQMASHLGDVLMQEEIVHSLWGDKVPLTEIMTHHLIEGLIRNHEIDRAIFLFRDLRARRICPRLRTYNLIISLCVDYVEPEEAFRTLIDLKETFGEASVGDRYWWRVLELCAKEGYVSHFQIILADRSYLEHYIVGKRFRFFLNFSFLKDFVFKSYRQQRGTVTQL